jgi:transcriptional regulator with XRE-family HTH domain
VSQQAAGELGAAGAGEPLGSRLRARRQHLNLTLKDVADRAGLSVGFISQIERGITTPSLSSLGSVARVLGVHIGDFLSQPKLTAPMTRQSERPHFAIGDGSFTYERLSSSFPGNVLRSVIIHEPPGYRSEPIAHEGEEIFFILDGALTVEVDQQRLVLEAGDSIHFQSTRIHSTWNHTIQPATILHTCTMDVFGDEPVADKAEKSMAVRRNSGLRSTPKPRKIRMGNSS